MATVSCCSNSALVLTEIDCSETLSDTDKSADEATLAAKLAACTASTVAVVRLLAAETAVELVKLLV